MKRIFLFILLGISLIIISYAFTVPDKGNSRVVAPDLGTAVNYTFFTINGNIGNTGTSIVTGNLGTNTGAITGFATSTIVGSMHIANAETAQALTDLQAACAQLDAIVPTALHGPVLGNGETLYAGVYALEAAGSVANVLTLDGQGDTNAVFIFKVGGALTTGASTTVNLINGASACNVFWKAEGAIAMAASTVMKGTVIANNGAISMAAGGTLEGRMFSTAGAVTVDGITASIPRSSCTPPAPVVTSPVTYCQNTTAVPLTATGSDLVWGNGSLTAPTPSTTTIGSTDYKVTQTAGGCLSPPATITVTITAGPSAVVTYPGSPYRSDVATAPVTRTGTAGGTYSSTTGLSINAISGLVNVQASTLGTYTVTYTISAGSGCDQYQTTTGISIIPPPSVNLGTAAGFTLFTSSGAVDNTGISNINGNIGTNLGAVTGFGTSTVTGSIYIADAVTSTCAADLLSAYNQLNAFYPTSAHVPVLGNGETLFPGIYDLAAAGSVAGVLTLDAQGDAGALFVFKIGGAFTTGANTTVNLVNGASACNVYWKVEGAIAMGASTVMAGTLIANNGAASMAAGGTLKGRLFSTLGAVSIDAVVATIAMCSSESTWTGSVSTDWHTPGNWLNGAVPAGTANITVPAGVPNYPLLNTGTGSVKNITIQSNASFTITGAVLEVAGAINNSGIFDTSSGTVKMNGIVSQTIAANTFAGNQINDLILSNYAGLNLGGPLKLTGTLLVSNGQLNTGGYLTLISTATQTALIDGSGAGNVSGNVTMQRYLATGFGYKYFSSPFQAATVGNFSGMVDLNAAFPGFYKYIENQASSGFKSYTDTTNLLNPMNGYAADFGPVTAPKLISITGIVNNGALSSTLYNHNQLYTQGFNLMGNPYPSPIDWNAVAGWTKTNIDNAIYYFNSGTTSQYTGTYSTYINGISSDGIAGNIIASMQGFFVHVSDGVYPVTGTFAFDNNVRTNDLSPVFHNPSQASLAQQNFLKPRILLRLSAGFSDNTISSDPLIVYSNDAARPAFDQQLDAIKLMNTNELLPNLYSLSADAKKLVINALPVLDSLTVIPLGLQTGRDGVVTFNLRDAENLPAGLQVYLTDVETGIDQDLKQSPAYSISLKQGTYENRFSLRFAPLNAPPKTNKEDVYKICGVEGSLCIRIKLVNEQKGYLMINNIIGKLISRRTIEGNGDYELKGLLTNVIYVISFVTPAGRYTEKMIVTGR